MRFFAARPDDNSASIVNQGIPQFLRMMNGAEVNDRPPGLERFLNSGDSTAVIDCLFLAVYSRRPTAEEMELMTDFMEDSTEAEPASGVLWALLNSSEFVLNH